MIWIKIFLAAVLVTLLGCNQKPTSAARGVPAPAETTKTSASLPTSAQPVLKKITLYIGTREMEAEMALNQRQWETGMMFRTNMNANDGMLFVFGQQTQMSFWMKNTSVKLDAAYIDSEGVIAEIHKLEPFSTNIVFSASSNLQYVLETPKQWFEKNGVSTGHRRVLRSRFLALSGLFHRVGKRIGCLLAIPMPENAAR